MSETANDSIALKIQEVEAQPERRRYIVMSESGLFKNGKLYEQGEEIMLDAKTAANFNNLGEVEAAE